MPQEDYKNNLEFYFDDPRLRMTLAGRFFVRVMNYVGYLVVIAAAATFIISDVNSLRVLSVFLVIFLIDRVWHRDQGRRPLNELPRHGRVNLSPYLKPRAFSVLEKAFDRSLIAKRDFYLEATRELLGLSEVEDGLKRLDVRPDEFKQKLDSLLSGSVKPTEAVNKSVLAGQAEKVVLQALPLADGAGHKFIHPGDLFAAVPLVGDSTAGRLFSTFSIEPQDLERAMLFAVLSRASRRHLPVSLGGFVPEGSHGVRKRIMNRAWTARPTPTLDLYSTDFTALAREGEVGLLVGHEAEYNHLVATLARPINPNALLVGEAGVGKETIISHLAFKLVKDEVPPPLFDKRLVALEIGNLVAGAAPDELALRLERIVKEIVVAGNIILYIPEIHNLVKTSGSAYISAADALLPIMRNNAFPVVGASYPKEFKEFIEPRSDFLGVFEVVRVQEISEENAEKLLIYESAMLERQYNLTISFAAVKKAVFLAHKYLRTKFLPSSAEELLKDAIVLAKRRDEKILKPEIVVDAAEAKVNVPIHEVTAAEAEELLNLEKVIHERLIDQEEAVKSVADALREYRSGLARGTGPIAAFLFVGPTGVGKTELAKTLAKVQFGSEKMMVRFDMSEYQDKQSFYRFIGSPDGQITGALTEAVGQRPYCLVLLDEFEKAYPDILNLFLQVFDDGRLTDNFGRVVDFTNTIIIATSNAHSDIINEALSKGESMTDIAEYLKKKLVDVFRPELLNRFSKVVVFKNLSPDNLKAIVRINLADLAASVKNRGIEMSFDDEAVRQVLKLGYDPAYGARPLRRVIEEKLKAPLAGQLLGKKLGRGSRVRLVLKGDEFSFVTEE